MHLDYYDGEGRGSEAAVGYSPVWLNRPVADNARQEVFEIAAGGHRATHLTTLRTQCAEHQVQMQRERQEEEDRMKYSTYQPWLDPVRGGGQRLSFHEIHQASQRAFRQRKLFNGLTRVEPAELMHVPLKEGTPKQRSHGAGAVSHGAPVRLPTVLQNEPKKEKRGGKKKAPMRTHRRLLPLSLGPPKGAMMMPAARGGRGVF